MTSSIPLNTISNLKKAPFLISTIAVVVVAEGKYNGQLVHNYAHLFGVFKVYNPLQNSWDLLTC